MSKKLKDSLRATNFFEDMNDESDASADTSFEVFDSKLFGAIEQSDANRQMAQPISIAEIWPDPKQPRRAIPSKVREQSGWDGDVDNIAVIFETWEELVNVARQKNGYPAFNLKQYLKQDIEVAREHDIEVETQPDLPTEIGSLEQSLVNLVELATSIHSSGLANPITVVLVPGRGYTIETGERRWLAYHLLLWHTEEKKYSKIAARTVDKLDIWRQAAENNARSNLNAISKARQFAVLLMDLLTEQGNTFQPFGTEYFVNEQAYYAQVEDGDAYRIPRGKSEKLLNATGLKSGKQLREYRALLRLPNRVWKIADDLNWPERAIRDLRKHAINDADLERLALEKAVEEGYEDKDSVPMGTVSPDKAKSKAKKAKTKQEKFTPDNKQYYTKFLKVLGHARSGKEEALEEAYRQMDEIRAWLDEQENQLSRRK